MIEPSEWREAWIEAAHRVVSAARYVVIGSQNEPSGEDAMTVLEREIERYDEAGRAYEERMMPGLNP